MGYTPWCSQCSLIVPFIQNMSFFEITINDQVLPFSLQPTTLLLFYLFLFDRSKLSVVVSFYLCCAMSEGANGRLDVLTDWGGWMTKERSSPSPFSSALLSALTKRVVKRQEEITKKRRSNGHCHRAEVCVPFVTEPKAQKEEIWFLRTGVALYSVDY